MARSHDRSREYVVSREVSRRVVVVIMKVVVRVDRIDSEVVMERTTVAVIQVNR